ncbi:MAG: MBL fold metallo-hydrolase [Leptolyngbyaceae cyanobacterium]
MFATWLDNNSWLWEIANQKILVDPWLIGTLTFSNTSWFFEGKKIESQPIPTDIDFLLLSQGLEDHAHPATLQALNKSIPVVGSPNAAQVVRKFGFTDITVLHHGESIVRSDITIKAVAGAPIGPTLTENGYIVHDTATGLKLFYEPHGYHPPALKDEAPIDVVLTPMENLSLPLAGNIIRGLASASELANWLKPQVMLPTTHAQETKYSGLLTSIIGASGGPQQVRQQVTNEKASITVLEPKVGERIALDIQPQRIAV